jgi:hypothetical protein
MQEQEPSGRPETARQAAKVFMQPYVLDGWEMKELSKKQPRTARPEFAAQVGGGTMRDHEGRERTINREQLVVTRITMTNCFAVFDLAEIIAELRDEQRGYHQQSLVALFAQEQEQRPQAEREGAEIWQALAPMTPAQRKRPAVFRSYQGGFCRQCNAELGYIEADGGRDREFCDNNGKCRVAYHRARKREEKRQQVLHYHAELREYWKLHGIRGEVLFRLQEILLQHGKAAARAATNAVLVACAAQEQAGNNEQVRLIEECMLGGEAIGFEEVKLEEFRIPQEVGGWSEFVTYASTNLLRQLRGYLYDRQYQAEYQQLARKRLEKFSRQIEQAEQRSTEQP